MKNPFLIEGPAVISFSGGRTSGYMLWRILQAHQWILPDDVRVIFANTGKEMPETLDFVQACSTHWVVPITWLEFCRDDAGKKSFRVVDFSTASRDGEPFWTLIDRNGSPFLPNPVARICTVEMKILTLERYLKSLGWDQWDSAVGIRADEPYRVTKIRADPSGGRKGVSRIMPLVDAGIDASQVGEFWRKQPFDLQLPNMNGKTMHGNCDLCFLKGPNQIMSLIRENPKRALFWIRAEEHAESRTGNFNNQARFRKDRPSYKQMYDAANNQVEMFDFDEPLQDCMCVD